MIADFILEFLVEIIRDLFVEELSVHVRRGARRMVRPPRGNLGNIRVRIHDRNRRRLLNRLLTEIEREL